jgi:molecular chaperone DnaJ
MTDYYEILEVSRDAGKDEIKAAFRRKARMLHPDVNKEPDAAERFKELGKAYETLMDDGKRATYDRFGEDGLKNAGFDTGGPFAGGFGGLDEVINSFMEGMFGSFGFGYRDPNAPQRGEDLRFDIEISFEDAVFGMTKEIKFEHLESCTSCGGTGAARGSGPVTCPKCQGSGQVQQVMRTPLGSFAQIGMCPECRGSGQVIKNPCPDCKGGSVRRQRQLEVKVPAGIDDMSNMRLSGEGNAGSNGGQAGDLFVVVHVKPSDYFKRDGANVYTKLEITPAQAALGDEIAVRSLDGEAQVQIPAGVQTGQQVKIKGAGVPLLGRSSHRGDHVIIVSVITPTRLSDEEKNLYKKLYELNTGKKPKKGLAWLPLFLIAFFLAVPAFAAKVPDNIQQYVNSVFPNTYFRFDGLVVLPDNTVYLPLFPAKIIKPEKLEAVPKLNTKPNVVIFNNDFVLLKVINNSLADMPDPPAAVRSGLLPQDLLTPPNLAVPESLKGITGNLTISREASLRTTAMSKVTAPVPNKNFYITTPRNKNIQVSDGWAIAQKNVPISVKLYDDRFLLVTSFNKRSLDVISVQDESVIKQFEFKSNPEEIIIDAKNKLAYVSVSEDIYVINLTTMTLLRQIKVSGMCQKLSLSADGTKLFYYDKKTRDIMAVELNNNYLLRNLGRFPNVSKIAYASGKVYATSRTTNRLAIIDYDTVGLIAEVEVAPKPVDMLVWGGNLFILSANELQVLNIKTDRVSDDILLSPNGFATGIVPVEGDLGIITDVVQPVFTLINLKTKQVVKSGMLGIPAGSVVVGGKVNALYPR